MLGAGNHVIPSFAYHMLLNPSLMKDGSLYIRIWLNMASYDKNCQSGRGKGSHSSMRRPNKTKSYGLLDNPVLVPKEQIPLFPTRNQEENMFENILRDLVIHCCGGKASQVKLLQVQEHPVSHEVLRLEQEPGRSLEGERPSLEVLGLLT